MKTGDFFLSWIVIQNLFLKRLKKVFPSLISKIQTAYVKGRFISEGGRLFSDILEISDNLKIKGFLRTMDIEKAFDSVNHLFLITALEKSLKRILLKRYKF